MTIRSSRLREWLLCGQELKEARATLDHVLPRSIELAERARAAFDHAELQRFQFDPGGSQPLSLIAEMYRQAAYFALRSVTREGKSADVAQVWQLASPEVPEAERQSEGEPRRAAERLVLSPTGLPDLEALSAAELKQATRVLRDFAARALVIAERPRTTVDALESRRAFRVVLTALALVGFSATIGLATKQVLRQPDLANGARWRTSSKLANCHPDVPDCDGTRTRVFFHTLEEDNPWFEYDFGHPLRFSSLAVTNRDDCCLERAVPLVVEVSNDAVSYQEIAATDDVFRTWKVHFPQQDARFLRLRVPRRTSLHLEAVKVYP